MTREARRHRSWRYALQCWMQRTHLRQAHADGAADCVCERSVWFFEKQKVSRHNKHGWMCSPKYHEMGCRSRVKRDMTRWGLAPRPWMIMGVS